MSPLELAGARLEADAMIEAAGLRVVNIEDNAAYQFISDSALGATKKYGVKSVSVLATKPGASVA